MCLSFLRYHQFSQCNKTKFPFSLKTEGNEMVFLPVLKLNPRNQLYILSFFREIHVPEQFIYRLRFALVDNSPVTIIRTSRRSSVRMWALKSLLELGLTEYYYRWSAQNNLIKSPDYSYIQKFPPFR